MRLVLMPRWSGTATSDWYPWLADELETPVTVAELDVPDAPTIEGCVARLRAAVGDDPDTYLVGHSVSCLAIVHMLAAFSEGRVPGAVFVAGWWHVDEPWDTLRPWMETPVDAAAARRAVDRSYVLLSDNDPFTADHRETSRLWRERLGADVRIVPGAAHFNGTREPAVRDLIAHALRA